MHLSKHAMIFFFMKQKSMISRMMNREIFQKNNFNSNHRQNTIPINLDDNKY